ncbi:hypothetical protein BBP40_008490 [Aspergillus hancockii]|nr:hypothetical protein BBP40_008490 [Aspergillus hancockii]
MFQRILMARNLGSSILESICREIENMSYTFCYLDWERSVTFLNVGSKRYMNLMMERVPLATLSDSTLTYVRCDTCITARGRLPQEENFTEVGDVDRFEVVNARISKNITTFTKIPEQEAVIVGSKSTVKTHMPCLKPNLRFSCN